jgi:dTDP-4-dehydrorhamnose 3,5-epimerase
MGTDSLNGIQVTSLNRILLPGGDVMHAMKHGDPGYNGFGEAYFSWIKYGVVKAWKRHTQMTLNLVVPIGNVKFVFFDEAQQNGYEVIAGSDNYVRVTVQPGIWFGFQGLYDPQSLVLNVANIPHDPAEVERLPDHSFTYNWIQL